MSAANPPTLLQGGIVDVKFGPGVRIVQPVNLYGCELGAATFIGPFTEIQRGVVVGARCRIQSHALVCELVTIGDDCFIGHGVVFINDLFEGGGPARGDRSKWKATRIGNRVSIGSNATILPVTIADGTVIGAGAVVTRSIAQAGVYAGNPAKLIRLLPG
jgi:acetyltransferase-like isoleucine patch superfamily enzyme